MEKDLEIIKNWKSTQIRFKKMIGLLEPILKPGMNILDVGCVGEKNQEGLTLKILKNKGFNLNLYGVDKINFSSPDFKFSKCDIEKEGLPFSNNYFDVIMATEIIAHLYNEEYFLQELKRCLKHQGYLLLTAPNISCLKSRLKFLIGKYPLELEHKKGEKWEMKTFNNFKSLEDKLNRKGFIIIKKVTNNFPYFINFPFNILALKLGNIYYKLGKNIIILSQKI